MRKLAQALLLNQIPRPLVSGGQAEPRVYKKIPFKFKLDFKRDFSTKSKILYKNNLTFNIPKKYSKIQYELNLTDKSLNHLFNKDYPLIVKGIGKYLITEDKREIFDACSGSAVASIGYGNQEVIEAIYLKYKNGTHYLATAF